MSSACYLRNQRVIRLAAFRDRKRLISSGKTRQGARKKEFLQRQACEINACLRKCRCLIDNQRRNELGWRCLIRSLPESRPSSRNEILKILSESDSLQIFQPSL